MDQIIELKGIKKSVQDGEEKLDILKGLDLSLGQGEVIAIVGKSGSGKTTLLNIISLLDTEYIGEYFLLQKPIGVQSPKELFKLRIHSIANIFQDFQLIEDLNVIQNIEIPLGYRGMRRKEREKTCAQVIKSVGLTGRENSIVSNLSGGEQQRVAIARAIVSNPKILLADEPTGNLDEVTSEIIINLLLKLNRENHISMILVTHDMDIARRCDRFYVLEGGVLHEK